MDKDSLKPVIESLIFASEGAITIQSICNIIEGVDRQAVRSALNELIEDYKARAGGLLIEEVAGGYQMRTNPEFSPWIRRLFKVGMQKLSRAAMESLAIIAYKQPLTRGELEAVRGVDSGAVLATLMDKRLIKIVGRKEAPGRPVVYGTTKEFLETFDLKDLSCLPSLKDIQTLEVENAAKEAQGLSAPEGVSSREGAGEKTGGLPGAGEAAEGDSGRRDNIEEEGRGTDPGGESQGKRGDGDGAGDKG